MKTLAQLKRDLKVGTKLKTIFNLHGKYLGSIRTISKVQTNGIYLETNDGTRTFNSWLPFPKKTSYMNYENNTFEFYDNYSGEIFKCLAYEIITEER